MDANEITKAIASALLDVQRAGGVVREIRMRSELAESLGDAAMQGVAYPRKGDRVHFIYGVPIRPSPDVPPNFVFFLPDSSLGADRE